MATHAPSTAEQTINIEQLNQDIEHFPQVHPITPDMAITHEGVSRMVMLDRYAFKDTKKETLAVGDLVILTVKPDPQYPARGIGYITEILEDSNEVYIQVEAEYIANIEDPAEQDSGIVKRSIDEIDKPLEIYYEQIAKRNATGLAAVEEDENSRKEAFERFYEQLSRLNLDRKSVV